MTALAPAPVVRSRPVIDRDEAYVLYELGRQTGASARFDVPFDDPASAYAVHTIDGAIVAFARIVGPAACEHAQAELDMVYVFEHHRGHGLGRALIHDTCRLAARSGATRLQVVAQPWVEGFFRRVGARRAGWRLPDPQHGWSRPLFTLDLHEPETTRGPGQLP